MKKLLFIGENHYQIQSIAFDSDGNDVAVKSDSYSLSSVQKTIDAATQAIAAWTNRDMEAYRATQIQDAQIKTNMFTVLQSLTDSDINSVKYVDELGNVVPKPTSVVIKANSGAVDPPVKP